MKKLSFILLFILLNVTFGFSQTNYEAKQREPVKISATDIGLDLGKTTSSFKAGQNFTWSILNASETEASLKLKKLTDNLKSFGFSVTTQKTTKSILNFTASCTEEIDSETFRKACIEAGFNYIKIGNRIKFLNLK